MIFDKWLAAFAHEKQTCGACKNEFTIKELRRTHFICPHCEKYMRIGGRERINQVVDKKSFTEFATGLSSVDFLEFPGYSDKLTKAIDTTGEDDAVVCGYATIGGHPCAIFVMDSRFMMASMGSVVGEKITRTFEYATEYGLPVIGFTASGGARMQEGILSLMQMAKTSGALARHRAEKLGYIVIMTNPTYGGVSASFATLGDVILAEPGAMVGFAGPRVVQETTKSTLPEGFQTAEFLLDKGLIDRVVERKNLRKELSFLLEIFHKAV